MDGSQDVGTLLAALFVLGLQGGVSVVVIAMVIVYRRSFVKHWRPGLWVGIVTWLLLAPMSVLTVMYFDPSAMMPGAENDAFLRAAGRVGVWLGVVVGVGKIGWWLVVYVAAAGLWHRIHPAPLALVEGRGRRPIGAVVGALGFGVAAGVVSMAVFMWLGVSESQAVKMQTTMMAGVEALPPAVRMPAYLLAFVSVAIAEELTFRGVLLGALFRWLGRWGWPAAAAIVGVALLWAVMHVQNTDQPFVKIGQIFVVGVVLGEMARRWGLETAVAGHVGLNVTAGTLAFVYL